MISCKSERNIAVFLPGQFLLLGGKKFKVLTNSLSRKMMSSVLNFPNLEVLIGISCPEAF